MWLEVFKSGEHKDSSGKLRKFTDDMLDKITALYNRKVKESSSYEAPLVKGHPKTDDPAYGWIENLKRKGNTLLAKLKDVSNDLVDEVKKGLFKKISIALYPDLMLRHVGLLGASAPAVKGLRNVEFEDDKEFSELITNDQLLMTNEEFADGNSWRKEKGEGKREEYISQKTEEGKSEEQNDGKMEGSFNERISELEEVNNELKLRNEELERGIRINEYREFVNSLIEFEAGGIITPAEGEELVDILIRVDSNDLEFTDGEGKKEKGERKIAERIKSLFNGMKPRVSGALFSDSFSHQSTVDSQQSKSERDFDLNKNVNPERMELHRKAKEIQLGNSCMTYEEAVQQALSL